MSLLQLAWETILTIWSGSSREGQPSIWRQNLLVLIGIALVVAVVLLVF